MTRATAKGVASGAIVVLKKNGGQMKWQFDTRNWCILGSHEDCDIQLLSQDAANVQALVKLDKGQLWIQALYDNEQTVIPGYGAIKKGDNVPLPNGNLFSIGSRLFRAEMNDSAPLAQQSDEASASNPYVEELNLSARKKGYGPSASKKGQKTRRTSLVLSTEEEKLVQATTETVVFPSSVLDTPSASVSDVLNNQISSTEDVGNDNEQDMTEYRTTLSYSSSSEEESDDSEDEDLEGEDSSSEEEAENEFVCKIRVPAKPDSREPSLAGRLGRGGVQYNPSAHSSPSAGTPFSTELTSNEQPETGAFGDTDAQPAQPVPFSRWRRKRKTLASLENEATEQKNYLSTAERKREVAKVPPNKVSALSRKQMAFDRLSQGLPATPMKWETGSSDRHLGKKEASKSAKSSCKSGKENASARIQERSSKTSDKKSITKADHLSPNSPAVVDCDLPNSTCPDGIGFASQETALESPTRPFTSSNSASGERTPQQSPRRSVLFTEVELGQGPHYSPVRIRSRSKSVLDSHPTLRDYPQPSPSSSSSEETFTNLVQGPPPTDKLEHLGTFFYPTKEIDSDVEEGEEPVPVEKMKQKAPVSNSMFSAYNEICSQESSASPLGSSGSQGSAKNWRRSSNGTIIPSIIKGDRAISNPGENTSSDNPSITATTTGTPRRRSILSAVLDAAKAVTERFSMSRPSSVASADTGSSEVPEDPEHLETASESEEDIPSVDYNVEGRVYVPETISDDEENRSQASSETQSATTTAPDNLDLEPNLCTDSDSTTAGRSDSVQNETAQQVLEESKVLEVIDLEDSKLPEKMNLVDEDSNDEAEVGTDLGEELAKFRKMRYVALRKHMKKLGLDTTGKKEVLLERLISFIHPVENVPSNDHSPMPSAGALDPSEEQIVVSSSEAYHGRTVKELQAFLTAHKVAIPQRSKKADLIDLMISSGIDCDGNVISLRGDGKVLSHQTPKSRKSKAMATTPSSKQLTKSHEDKVSLQTPSSSKPHTEATPIRRSTRKRKLVTKTES